MEAIEERDNVLQRLEDADIRQVNNLEETIVAMQRQHETYDFQAIVFMAEQHRQLTRLEAQNKGTNTAPLDLKEWHQVVLPECQTLNIKYKEQQETDTAITATLAFATVRSEDAMTVQEDLDDTTAEDDEERVSGSAERTDDVPNNDNDESIEFSTIAIRDPARVPEQMRSRG